MTDRKYYLLDKNGNLLFPKSHKWISTDKSIKNLVNGKILSITKYTGFPSKPKEVITVGKKQQVELKITNFVSNTLLFVLKGDIETINKMFVHQVTKSPILTEAKRKEAIISLFNLCFNIPTANDLEPLRLRLGNNFQYLLNSDLKYTNRRIFNICKLLRINKSLYKYDPKVYSKLGYTSDTIIVKKTYISNNHLLNDFKLTRDKKFLTGFNKYRLLRSLNDVRLNDLSIIPINFSDSDSMTESCFIHVPPMNKQRMVMKPKPLSYKIEIDTVDFKEIKIKFNNRTVYIRNDIVLFKNTNKNIQININEFDKLIDDKKTIKVTTFLEHKKEFDEAIKELYNGTNEKPNNKSLWTAVTDISDKNVQKKIVELFNRTINFLKSSDLDILVDILSWFNSRQFFTRYVLVH